MIVVEIIVTALRIIMHVCGRPDMESAVAPDQSCVECDTNSSKVEGVRKSIIVCKSFTTSVLQKVIENIVSKLKNCGSRALRRLRYA